jgi:hypothetical protein
MINGLRAVSIWCADPDWTRLKAAGVEFVEDPTARGRLLGAR